MMNIRRDQVIFFIPSLAPSTSLKCYRSVFPLSGIGEQAAMIARELKCYLI